MMDFRKFKEKLLKNKEILSNDLKHETDSRNIEILKETIQNINQAIYNLNLNIKENEK